VDLPLLVSVEATGVCIPIGNNEILLASVYKSPGCAWSDADITELFLFWQVTLMLNTRFGIVKFQTLQASK
jgi:hypothetical protein